MSWHEDEDARDELRELNEAIATEEKRLLAASKNLSYLNNGHRLMTADDEEDEEERVTCEKQLLAYGEVLDALNEAGQSHAAQVATLRAELQRATSQHRSLRSHLTNTLLQHRMTLLGKQERKTVKQEDLERGASRQEAIEQTVIKLRTLMLLTTPTSPPTEETAPVNPVTVAEELALRERDETTKQQLTQVKRLLERQETEKRRDELQRIRLAERKEALEHDLRTILSDRDMARLEYADVCRQYKEEQRLSRALLGRVEEARTGRMVTNLASQHKDVIWRVVTLDTAVQRASQKCQSLQQALKRSERDERPSQK